jgi:D-glycero-alpha-D-manno-heptose 1-phosphate guanylyltransferase
MTAAVKTLFVDRDGVINRRRDDYVKSLSELEVLPGAIEALATASKRGLDVIVLTNQSAIGRHLVSREMVDEIHRALGAMVAQVGGSIRAFLVCPHTPDEACDCRKPLPGLFFRARDELGVDLSRAVMIGDQPSDTAAARAARCAAMLVSDRELGSAVDLICSLPAVEEAIVLCGGIGTRLRGVLGNQPKAMAAINGRPFLEWLLIDLARRGVRRAVLALGHGADSIRRHFATSKDLGIELVMSQEETPLGTGGAARLAVESTLGSPVLVLNGDSHSQFNLIQMLLTHHANRASATLWLTTVDDASRYGSVLTADDGRLTAFREKTEGSGAVNAGVYLIDRSVLCDIPAGRAVSLEHDVFPALVGHGLYAVDGDGSFVDIGTPESLAEAQRNWTNA